VKKYIENKYAKLKKDEIEKKEGKRELTSVSLG
jgi:hypothetical protein